MNKKIVETHNILTKILFITAAVYMSNEQGENSGNFFGGKTIGKFWNTFHYRMA